MQKLAWLGACAAQSRHHQVRRLRQPLYELAALKQKVQKLVAAPPQRSEEEAGHAVVQQVVEGKSHKQL